MDNFKKHFCTKNKPAWPNSQPKLLDIMVPTMQQVVFHPVSLEIAHHLHHVQ
jgi:hypothetical protein